MAGNSHGHTPAAWTGVIIAFIGFCVALLFTVAAQPVGFVLGIVITLVGALVGWIMHRAGMGQPRTHGYGGRLPEGQKS